MLEGLDVPIIGDNSLLAGEEKIPGKPILHIDEIAQVADPFHRLL
jgi:hypothetical protein